ncbi:hypothetical protein PVK64_20565, partial [Aliivibrio sp. S4TY2]|uniref:hypothetical protein n=1 Tax=unclassified Aliivibrio TaxID=2645654 RepID=UPI00237988A6
TGLSQYNPENTFSATPYDEYGNQFVPFIDCKHPFSFGSILIFIPEGAKRIQFRLSEGASSDISAQLLTSYYLV